MKKFLIVGLGNPGPEYHNTRHNIGFRILDFMAEKQGTSFETRKLGNLASFKFKGRSFILLKPSTYMNLSGKAVRYWLEKEKIPIENLLVITDDINLPLGTLRLKTKGSDGGHNGLKDVQNHLNTTKYNRFRYGVGGDFPKGRQIDFVLGKWKDEEENNMGERMEISTELVKSFGTAGIERTMNFFNGK